MSQTFRNWCEQNNLTTVLNKYLKADGTVKQQYVMADNQATALHNWHRDNRIVLTNQQMTMRVNNAGNGTDLQWTSLVTIMHSSATMISVDNFCLDRNL
eukprot:878508-Amphidinium_carterae.2